ncbi:hypothetical protein [Nocardioides szechwanensis]|uniref:hypothetical protein n=1 Tax=Nocardioides szechwanensis TaxID=1005944 RepID=UPI000B81B8ED|nr:hypothetical protein [Nocardioides szechwanensis]
MLTAAAVAVLVAVAAFAVDLGMQRVVRSDMQALADVVALDTARLLNGRTAKQIEDGTTGQPALSAVVASSVARNQASLGRVNSVTATLIYVVDGLNGEQIPSRTAAGALVDVPDNNTPDAVYVEAAGEVDFAFAPGSGGGVRTALGVADSAACFRLGSYAAALRSDSSGVLQRILGNALGVNAIGYEGLVDSSVSLGGIAAELGAGTPQDLMNTDVSVASLATAMATVLAREGGPTASTQVAVLRTLGQSSNATVLKKFKVGSVMDLTTAGPAALVTKVNVLDLVAATGFLANGNTSVKTGVIWNLPAVSRTEIELSISQVPQLACGRVGSAIARTGQFSYLSNLDYSRGSQIAGLTFQEDPVLAISADVARAQGTLTDLRCGAGTLLDQEKLTVHVRREAPNLQFDVPVHLKGSIDTSEYTKNLSTLLATLDYTATQIVSLLSNLNKIRIDLDLSFNLGARAVGAATDSDVPFAHLPDQYNVAVPVPGRSPAAIPSVVFDRSSIGGKAWLTVDGVVKGEVALGDVNLDFLLAEVNSRMIRDTINPLIQKINDVITPLSTALGVSLYGADLFALPRPMCGIPALAG